MCGRVSAPKWESRHRKELLLVSMAHSSDTLNRFQMNNRTGLACLTESDKITDVSVTVMAAYSLNVCVCCVCVCYFRNTSLRSGAISIYSGQKRERREQKQTEGLSRTQQEVGSRAMRRLVQCARRGVKEQAWKMKCTNGVDVESTEDDVVWTGLHQIQEGSPSVMEAQGI